MTLAGNQMKKEEAAECRFLRPSQVAKNWGVDERTVRRYIERGQLAAIRLPSGAYRIRVEDAERLGVSA